MTRASRVAPAQERVGQPRRRGRPQRLPEDVSPPAGHSVAADQRVAWLLATSRILGPDPELAHQEAFAHALRAQGHSVDNSRVSRWESGSRALPLKVISSYERILGLPDGAIVAVAISIYRNCGEDHPTSRRTQTELRSQQELDETFERAEEGQATGADWLRLAEDLTQYERVYLSPSSWKSLASRLVNELNRSVGAAYVRRREACAVLLGNPVAQRHVMRAVGELVTNPHAQILQPAVGLLSTLSDPASGALVLRMMESDSPMLRHAAAAIAPSKLAREHFTPADVARLETFVVQGLRQTNSVNASLHAIDLGATLPEPAFQRVCTEAKDNHQAERLKLARTSGLLIAPDIARSISRTLAARAQEQASAPFATEPDTMLQRLISEALFHAHKERRDQASILLAASAYAPAIAHGCVALTTDASEFVAARALAVLQSVGLVDHRDVVLRHAVSEDTPPTTRVGSLNALALSAETMDDLEADAAEQVLRTARHQAVRAAALFSLGMNAPDRVAALKSHDELWVAGAADWWTNHGSALRDIDDVRQPTANPAWIPAPRPS